MGSKRGKILIRQPRVKKDSDPLNQRSPELEQDSIVYSQTLTIPHHHHKIERHASEPAPIMTPSSPHLLSVPQPSFLVKQHSHPVLPSQSSQSPPSSGTYTFQRQLSHPNPMTSTIPLSGSSLVSTPLTATSGSITHLVQSSVKSEPDTIGRGSVSPTVVVISDPMITHEQSLPSIRVKSEELQRSISSPHTITRELSIENRSRHCPVVRPGPALGCNYCWNTIDAFGRILRRKTKYHCPECQTNLCIVPCFQEYHERQCNDSSTNDNSKNSANLRHYTKTGSM